MRPELFQAKVYAKHQPLWKIRFLLTRVSVHGNVLECKRQVKDTRTAVEGELRSVSSQPYCIDS